MQILIVDESAIFRGLLARKLSAPDVEVVQAVNGLDGIAKLRNALPDLAIVDSHLSRAGIQHFLEDKLKDPNAARIPLILFVGEGEKPPVPNPARYGVRQVLEKPLRIDLLFEAVASVLGIEFAVDRTPCMIEAHVNDDMLFVEIAMGLNRDKIDILRSKLRELAELHELRDPRVLVMASDLELGFQDGPNLQYLLDAALEGAGTRPRRTRVLSKSPFFADYVRGQKRYEGMKVYPDLDQAIADFFVSEPQDAESAGSDVAERLVSGGEGAAGSLHMRFDSARLEESLEALKASSRSFEVAFVDDDPVIIGIAKLVFGKAGMRFSGFENGEAFVKAAAGKAFDLVFLDIMMPGMDGFEVMKRLNAAGARFPVVMVSALGRKEAVVKARQLGVRSYMIKPVEPAALYRKTVEILRPGL